DLPLERPDDARRGGVVAELQKPDAARLAPNKALNTRRHTRSELYGNQRRVELAADDWLVRVAVRRQRFLPPQLEQRFDLRTEVGLTGRREHVVADVIAAADIQVLQQLCLLKGKVASNDEKRTILGGLGRSRG